MMKDLVKGMALLLLIGSILGVASTVTTSDTIDLFLGKYSEIFSTYHVLALLSFLITAITTVFIFADYKVGYGMLITLILFGLFAYPIGTIISLIFLIIIFGEYKEFKELL